MTLGSQQPRLLSLPHNVVGQDSGHAALKLAYSAGLTPDPWQEFCILSGCSDRRNGSWAAFENYLDVPRQNGKGDILMIRQLAGLFVFHEKVQLHSAHEFKTAREHFIRIRDVIDGAPHLSKRVKAILTGSGNESIVLKNGSRLLFVARSKASIRGFTGDTLYLDEAFKLSSEARGAMIPALSAVKNPQIWYASSAAHADSDALHELHARMVAGDSPRLFAASWSNEPGPDPSEVEAWARANPALGRRLSVEFTSEELMTLPAREFARERLGIPEGQDGGSNVLPLASWSACEDPASVVVGPVTIALDVTPEGSFGSFAVAGLRADGLAHVEVVDRRPGTAWIVARARELAVRWSTPILLDPRSPAGGFITELVAAGVEVIEVSGVQLAQGCAAFQRRVLEGQVRHIGQGELNASVVGVAIRPLGDAWAWSRVSSQVDISPLVAASLALWGSTRTGETKDFFVY